MIINKLVVEGGFLDGLQVSFSKGFNVIIGPRGTGKTSIIELIRFCLSVNAITDKNDLAAKKHAISILGNGRVTIELRNGDNVVTVTRSIDDSTSRFTDTYDTPLILSQNEIEEIGLDSCGRLQIIDNLLNENSYTDESFLKKQIVSISNEMQSVASDVAKLTEALESSHELASELMRSQGQLNELLNIQHITESDKKRLESLSEEKSRLSAKEGIFKRNLEALQTWREKFLAVSRAFPTMESVFNLETESADSSENLWDFTAKNSTLLNNVEITTSDAISNLKRLLLKNSAEIIQIENDSLALRAKLETITKGIGEISRKASQLKEKTKQFEVLRGVLASKRNTLSSLQNQRGKLLDGIDSLRSQKFRLRKNIVTTINENLKPYIRINIKRGALNNEYHNNLVNMLRGSGTQYNSVAKDIVTTMSPREFVEAVERNSPEIIAKLSGIAVNRCHRIIDHLSGQDLSTLITSNIEDEIEFSLLSGDTYLTTDKLSMGQRCAVILPIILGHINKPLLLDQPEDHLDNSYITNTLIKAILLHKQKAQLIVTSHNANIPVLGEADKIVVMGSDGKKGYTKVAAALPDERVVNAITNIMEGGLAAFSKRASFYHSGPLHG